MTAVFLQPFIRCSLQCRDLVDEAKKFHLRPELRSQMQGPRTRARLGERCGVPGAAGAACVPCSASMLCDKNFSVCSAQWHGGGRVGLLTSGSTRDSWLSLLSCQRSQVGLSERAAVSEVWAEFLPL